MAATKDNAGPKTVRRTGGSQPSRRGTAAKANAPKARKPVWRRIVDVLLIIVDVLVVGALCLTSYAGMVSPLKNGGIWGIFPLGLPIVLLVMFGLTVLQLFINRKGLFILLGGVLLCGGPLLTYCPLHIGTDKPREGAETFTLLTYNVLNFEPEDTAMTKDGSPALDYILRTDADVVCLQEVAGFAPGKRSGITPGQLDKLHSQYPYVIVSGKAQAFLSKYPVQPIHLDNSEESFVSGDIGAYRITLPTGKLVTIFNVHLYSYSLNADDKEIYVNLTGLKREPFSDVRSQLLHKLRVAAEGRARQAIQMQRWIRLYGGPDCIVCGDFNDVQGCYTIRHLAESGFEDVYPRVGFGPMITYHDDRFYFCIDHILSRGNLKPLWLRKGRLTASDHYPLLTEFEII